MSAPGSHRRALGGTLLAFALGMDPAAAQQVATPGFGGCGSFNAERRLEFTLATAVPRGQTLSLAIALGPSAASGLALDDSRGNVYRSLAAARGRERGAAAMLWTSQLQQGLAAGDRLQLRLDSHAAGARACVLALGYTDLLSEARALRAAKAGRGEDAQPTLSLLNLTPSVAQATLAVFAFEANPGALSAAGDASVLGPLCASGGSPCLALVHAQGEAGSAIAPTVVLTAAQGVRWQGAAAVLPRASLFRNGFEP